MKYAKLENGSLTLFTGVLRESDSRIALNPPAEKLAEHGYFPVDETPPAVPDGQALVSESWVESGGKIVRKGEFASLSTLSGLRDVLKTVASRVSVSLSLLPLALFGASYVTAPLLDMDLDTAKVVTNVDFAGLATDERLDAATNAVRVYADGAVGAATNALWSAVDDNSDGVASLSSAVSSKAGKSEVRAVSNDLAAVASSVSTMWWQVYGDTVWMAVTNYMRTTSAKPSMGLWEARDGSTNCVWSSAEEISAATNAVRVEIAESVSAARETADAAKSWGRWQSADGSAAVSNYTMVSTPYLMLTGGGKWEQRTVEGGSYWLFCGAGSVGGTEDGGLRLRNSDGDVVFEVTQGTMQEVSAVPESFIVQPQSGTLYISYVVYATSEPTLYWTTDLASSWEKFGSAGYSSWTKTSDSTYAANFTLSAAEYPTAFFRAVYETGSESIVDFKKALKVDKIVVGDTTYSVSVGTMSDGTKFLKLE